MLRRAALGRENLLQAFKRVRANKGAAGVDGRDIDETSRYLALAWPEIREQLLAGTYRPSHVRRVTIPKPDGAKLHLVDNESKSAVGSSLGRKFLGYSLWVGRGKVVKLKVADKPLVTFKQRIRELIGRSTGRSMGQIVEKLRSYMLGWKGYFKLAETPKVWQELDEWLRHRLRAIQLKHWKPGKTMYRELLRLGAMPLVARVAASNRCWWRNADLLLKTVLTIAYFDRLGVPRLS